MEGAMCQAGDDFYPTVETLMRELDLSWQSGRRNDALIKIQSFVEAVMLDRRSIAKVFADAALDVFCQKVGRICLDEIGGGAPVRDEERADCVVLATEFYRTGGHTSALEDLLSTGCFGTRIVILLTDVSDRGDTTILHERFGTLAAGEIAPAGSLLNKLSWTLSRLQALRPRKLLLLNHHNDSVSIAAAQPDLADQTIFYHHGDHHLCLGVTLEHAIHVDPHPMGLENCGGPIGIKKPVYWPLIAKDHGDRPHTRFLVQGALKTCSSGSFNKFSTSYKYAYADILPRVLSDTHGTHVHIGPLSEAVLAQIRHGLVEQNVPLDRFIHVPWVSSVWKALHEYEIDLYIASFPLGGGKTAIEVMGAGIPIVGHISYISPFHGGLAMFYPGAFGWGEPDQLLSHLRQLDATQLALESREARRHYERFHTLRALTAAIDSGTATPPPQSSTQRHIGNPLQSFLDDVHYALEDHLSKAALERVKREANLTKRRALEAQAEQDALKRAFEFEAVELARLASQEPREQF